MRKKGLLIQSVIIIVVSVLALTVITFAWFAPPWAKVESFDVKVVDLPKIKFDFYRNYEDGNGYVKVEAGHSFVDEILFPGKNAYSRIDIFNTGSAEIFVSVAFTGITYSLTQNNLTDSEKFDIIKTDILPYLKIFVFETEFGEAIPDITNEREINILQAVGVPIADDRLMLSTRNKIIGGAGKTVYYRFYLDSLAQSVDGVFNIHASGITFFAS